MQTTPKSLQQFVALVGGFLAGVAAIVLSGLGKGWFGHHPAAIAESRMAALSFWLMMLFLLALVFRRCWNALAGDFAWLAALTLRKSLTAVLLISVFLGLIQAAIPPAWDRMGMP